MTAVAALALLAAPPASASVVPNPPGTTPHAGTPTQMLLSSLGPGQGVHGFIANADSPFDPVSDGYPSGNPTTGFTAKNEGFAGVIHGRATDGSNAQLNLYCFDINTNTNVGINYRLGTWNGSNVPNVNYVAQVLNHFYPHTDRPAALTNLNQRAAAVQSAVWFFSDRYVLSTSDPLRPFVVDIVNEVIALGPAAPPHPPSVNITPTTLSGTAGILGPFTVTATGPATSATVTALGADMFRDAAATQPITTGAVVPSGTEIWLKKTASNNTHAAVLQATAKATVPQNNVYLYDGTNSGVADAQRLILSQDATLTTTVNGNALFTDTGSLIVKKTITGPAAGRQGAVTILVRCGGVLVGDPFDIPAREPAGTTSKEYDNIPVGTTCTVTEQHDGSSSTVTVDVTGSGQEATIPSGAATVAITDTYRFANPGTLVVKKSIEGEGAGSQGQIVIQPTCDGKELEPFTIPAGATGEPSKTYTDLAPASTCTITETVDGHNTAVSVVTAGSPQSVAVPGGEATQVQVTDTYTLNPGSLTVSKTITGPGAGQQGPITITVSCVHNGNTTVLNPPFTIPAGTTAPPVPSHTYTDIPGGSVCTVVEGPDGNNATVAVVKRGSGQEVTIPPGGHATADLTDTYATGELVVNKTIDGNAAGHQGEVTIHTVCNGTAQTPDLVIPAGSPAGTYSQTYPDVIGGATCTVTETANGASSAITVQTTGDGQTLNVSANGTGTADLTDTYTFVPGTLTVTKAINGPSASQHGEIRIHVDCGELVATPDFVIPAGAAGQSHTYEGIPGNTVCTVTETQDGSSSTVQVTVNGSPGHVTVPANGTATSEITDTYAPAPGSLVVTKTINGPLAGSQGEITIDVTCGSTSLPAFTIPAGTAATTLTRTYRDIPGGSACTVTEKSDGATATVEATVDGGEQTVTVPPAVTQTVGITNTYSGTTGVLAVTKRLAGAGAGRQGRVGILVVCGEPLQAFAFEIPAKQAAGPVTQVFSGIGGGSQCLVAEVIDGHTGDLAVAAAGGHQQVSVPAGGVASAHMTDRFDVDALAVTGPRAPIAPLIGIALAAIVAGAGVAMLGRRRA